MRRELYAQCFDELIRQCTINCTERGLLLLRVRDELRMTLHAYQTLYESSIAFGVRKALQAEQVRIYRQFDGPRYYFWGITVFFQVCDLEEQKLAMRSKSSLRCFLRT